MLALIINTPSAVTYRQQLHSALLLCFVTSVLFAASLADAWWKPRMVREWLSWPGLGLFTAAIPSGMKSRLFASPADVSSAGLSKPRTKALHSRVGFMASSTSDAGR